MGNPWNTLGKKWKTLIIIALVALAAFAYAKRNEIKKFFARN